MSEQTAHLERLAEEHGSHTPERDADLFSRISAIERACPSPKDRASSFLEAVADAFGGLAGAVTIAAGGEEHDLRHTSEVEGAGAWLGLLAEAALEARSHAKTVARLFASDRGEPAFAMIACPIDSAGRDPFGGVAILVRCQEIPEAERIQLHLRSACLHAAGMLSRPPVKQATVEMDDIARVYTRAGTFKGIHEFAYAITNAVRQRFDCDQAAMGWLRRGKVSLLCISGLDTIKKRSPGVHRIEQAMGECADARQPVASQPSGEWDNAEFAQAGLLHARWRGATDNACVMSIPVLAGDDVVAVLSFRRRADRPFDADDLIALQKLIAPLGGAVPLVARSTRPLAQHTTECVASAAAWMAVRGSLRKRVALVVACVAATWLALTPSSYKINTHAVVRADRERVVAAPIDGAVARVLVRSGDRVEAGQTLARMDTAMLDMEASQIESGVAASEAKMNAAMAEGDTGAAAVARAEMRAELIRLDGVRQRIAAATILAPATGTVIGAELADTEGQIVAVGHPLLSIAEEGSLVLELQVPQSRVADLQSGLPVRFASHARPESPGLSEVATVSPSSVERMGRQVFIAEAGLPDGLDWLRPGMEGVGIIDAGERPNWWLATHRITDAARLRFWID